MKILKKVALIIALITTGGCAKDFLEVSPRGDLTLDKFFKTEEHALLATNAVYSILRRWEVHTFAYVGVTDILSDDADKGSEPNDAAFLSDIDNLTFDAGNIAPLTVWQGYYTAIYRANLAIENIPSCQMNEILRGRLVAECKFLRGYFYFNLVRWFGNVPLITKPLTADEFKQARVSKDLIYAQIVKDMTEAIAVLPEKSQYASDDLGRVTKGAAKGMLAKVYLTLKDYPNAEKTALEVLNSTEYDLTTDYTNIFTREGENGRESLFEVQCTNNSDLNNGGSQFNEIQGTRGSPDNGWGFNRPSDSFISEFEPGDPRRDATILYEGEVFPDGSDILAKNPNVFNARYNQKAWVPRVAGRLNGVGQGNIRILRFADVVLIAAEALNENGKTAPALTQLNAVRKRARGGANGILPDVKETDKVKLRTAIWHERRVEMGMEQQRWFDLVRTGQVEAAMKKHGKNNVSAKHLLLPIPQKEIDLSGQTLTQNLGY